jgi:hypothetical protein
VPTLQTAISLGFLSFWLCCNHYAKAVTFRIAAKNNIIDFFIGTIVAHAFCNKGVSPMKNIKKLIEKSDYTYQEIADHLEIDRITLWRKLNNLTIFRQIEIDAIKRFIKENKK